MSGRGGTARYTMFAAALLLLAATALADVAASWHEGFGPPPAGLGLDGDPRALMHDAAGRLYCGGSFSQAGPVTTWFVARLERQAGSPVWSSLGDMDNRVDALAAWGDSVLAGGRFTLAGGEEVNRVAVFHAGEWRPVGDPFAWSWGHVLSLTIHEGTPWAAGSDFVVRWTGAAWEAVTGAGFSGDVFALASFNGRVYATGAFSTIVEPSGASVASSNIAAWDGTWQSLGSGLNGTGYALEVWNNQLVVGGVFSSPGPLLAGWAGGSWTALGPALDGNYVIALAEWGTRLLVGGNLNGGGGVSLWDVAYLDGGIWNAMGGGVDGQVRAISAQIEDVVVGGSFLNAGGVASAHIGMWIDPAVGVEDGPPTVASLDQPAPNPFNPATTVRFRLASPVHVSIDIHALDGRHVATIASGQFAGGLHAVVWRGRDDDDHAVPSGCYVVRLRAGDEDLTRRITLLR